MTWRREKEEAVGKSVDERVAWNSLAIDASFAIVWLGVGKISNCLLPEAMACLSSCAHESRRPVAPYISVSS